MTPEMNKTEKSDFPPARSDHAMVLVVGSTGLLGSEIVRRARARGLPVRALARPSASPVRLEALRTHGAEIVWGDLKDRGSLEAACRGVDAVVSTASSTLSRQPGDDIESVDRHGQIALVEAARSAGVRHFTFFGLKPEFGDSPLLAAKQALEQAVQASGMAWTNLMGHMFMELWLSPVVGFDYPNGRVTFFGDGHAPHRWVSYRDLAEAAVFAHQTPAAASQSFDACGPEALTQRQVVALFEAALGRKFEITEVPEEVLAAQAREATDPLQKTFALLQLACARGVELNPQSFIDTFGLALRRVEDYVREVVR
jgi:uncharacterized protein YbjT (DUF2867 family)